MGRRPYGRTLGPRRQGRWSGFDEQNRPALVRTHRAATPSQSIEGRLELGEGDVDPATPSVRPVPDRFLPPEVAQGGIQQRGAPNLLGRRHSPRAVQVRDGVRRGRPSAGSNHERASVIAGGIRLELTPDFAQPLLQAICGAVTTGAVVS